MPPNGPAVDRDQIDHFALEIARSQVLTQLMARVGFAVWQVAECEDTLAHYVVIRLRESKGVGEEQGRELLAKHQGRTFGQLLGDLRKAGILDPSVEARASKLLAERNWLIHDAKRENRGLPNDLERVGAMTERLDWIADEALALNKILEAELEEIVVASGVDRKRIDEEAAKLRQKWGY